MAEAGNIGLIFKIVKKNTQEKTRKKVKQSTEATHCVPPV
jgi:hypothetical protein